MIYRTNIAVLRAVPSKRYATEAAIAAWREKFVEAVACTFGVNAEDLAEAVSLAAAAAQDAVDRKGDYIGGVVIETNCRCVDPKEFDGYQKYFHRPMERRGIFYVSGTHTFEIPRMTVLGAMAKFDAARLRIERCGLPAPSFVHPELPEEPPTRVRLLCSVCGRWTEVDNRGVVFSFMPDAHFFTDTDPDARRSLEHAGKFMRAHLLSCLHVDKGPMRGSVVGIHQSDPRWATLDDSKREDEDVEPR